MAVVEPIDEEVQRISIREAKRSGIRPSSTGLVLRSARFFENLVIVRETVEFTACTIKRAGNMTTDNVLEQPPSRANIDCRGMCVSVESQGPTPVITVSGDIDASNSDFMATVLSGFATRNDRLVVDMRGVDFIGTAGVQVLVDFDLQCRREGAAWTLVPCRILIRLLQVVDVGRHLPVSDSVDDAVALLQWGVISPEPPKLPLVAPEKLRC
jgi:anti-anti-sigma factor